MTLLKQAGPQTLRHAQRRKMSSILAHPQRPLFILDFDNTITTKDTISTLFSQVMKFQGSLGNDLTKAHAEIISAYSSDFSAHLEDYIPKKEDRRTLGDDIFYQRGLLNVEMRSFERVSKSGIFRGIDSKQWQILGRQAVVNGEIQIRAGFDRFIQGAHNARFLWGIVSVNFSTDFIKGVIEAAAGFASCAKVQIVSNETRAKDGAIIGPELSNQRETISTSDGKLRAMQTLLTSWRLHQKSLGDIFYIGDSGTDIECLVDDDVTGVIMAPDGKSSLMDAMERIGYKVEHINNYQKHENCERVLYWAGGFTEIMDSPIFS